MDLVSRIFVVPQALQIFRIALVCIQLISTGCYGERCGFQNCDPGISYCFDQRCRFCSDLDNTPYDCTADTLQKCYRYCLEKLQKAATLREKAINMTWQGLVDEINETLSQSKEERIATGYLNSTEITLENKDTFWTVSDSILTALAVVLFFLTATIFGRFWLRMMDTSRRIRDSDNGDPELQKDVTKELTIKSRKKSLEKPPMYTEETSSLLPSSDLCDETIGKIPPQCDSDFLVTAMTIPENQGQRDLLRGVPVQNDVIEREQAGSERQDHETSRLVTNTSSYT